MDNRRGERGQVLVLGALVMTAMLAFLALVIDVGYGVAQRRFMQNAADAASVAAARHLANTREVGTTDAQVVAILNSYLTKNGSASSIGDLTTARYLQPDGVTTYAQVGFGGTIPAQQLGQLPAATGVEVNATKQFDTFFARVLGYDQMTVSATGAANFGQISQVNLDWTQTGVPVAPMAFDIEVSRNASQFCGPYGRVLNFDQPIDAPTLCDGQPGATDQVQHFDFTTLNINGSCSDNVERDVLGELMSGSGALAGQTMQIGVTPIQICSGVRSVNWDLVVDIGRPVLVPLIDHDAAMACNSNCVTPIIGVAYVRFEHVYGNGEHLYLDGHWVDPLTMDPIPGQAVQTITSSWTGPLSFTLVR